MTRRQREAWACRVWLGLILGLSAAIYLGGPGIVIWWMGGNW